MTRRGPVRVALAVAAGLVALAAAPAIALVWHWTEAPFPAEAVSGWVDTESGWSFPLGVDEVTGDSAGNVWAYTDDDDGEIIRVYLLEAGSSAWRDETGSLWAGNDGLKSFWDIEAVGDEVFISGTNGVWRRKASDSDWHKTKADRALQAGDMTVFDGTVWMVDLGPLMRYDRTSDEWRRVMDGIPKHQNGLDWGNFRGAANGRYLYAGLYGSQETDPSFPGYDVYRIAKGGKRWEATGLKLKAPTEWKTDEDASAGIHQVLAIDGYAFVNASDADGFQDLAFDEATGEWRTMAPPEGTFATGVLGSFQSYDWNGDWGDGLLHVVSNYDGVSESVSMLAWDPGAESWTASEDEAYAWEPFGRSGVFRVGTDLLLQTPTPDEKAAGVAGGLKGIGGGTTSSLSRLVLPIAGGLLALCGVVALVLWLVLKRRRPAGAQVAVPSMPSAAPPPPPAPDAGGPPSVTVPANAETKACPMCAEDIKTAAKVCRYCGATFDVERRGYCGACGGVKDADEGDVCCGCGSALVDPHIVSTVRPHEA